MRALQLMFGASSVGTAVGFGLEEAGIVNSDTPWQKGWQHRNVPQSVVVGRDGSMNRAWRLSPFMGLPCRFSTPPLTQRFHSIVRWRCGELISGVCSLVCVRQAAGGVQDRLRPPKWWG